jgi:hypothetical protein
MNETEEVLELKRMNIQVRRGILTYLPDNILFPSLTGAHWRNFQRRWYNYNSSAGLTLETDKIGSSSWPNSIHKNPVSVLLGEALISYDLDQHTTNEQHVQPRLLLLLPFHCLKKLVKTILMQDLSLLYKKYLFDRQL